MMPKRPKRPAGVIFLELEKLYDELIDDHEFQKGDILNWSNGHLESHRPDCIETYLDGRHPVFKYVPPEDK